MSEHPIKDFVIFLLSRKEKNQLFLFFTSNFHSSRMVRIDQGTCGTNGTRQLYFFRRFFFDETSGLMKNIVLTEKGKQRASSIDKGALFIELDKQYNCKHFLEKFDE